MILDLAQVASMNVLFAHDIVDSKIECACAPYTISDIVQYGIPLALMIVILAAASAQRDYNMYLHICVYEHEICIQVYMYTYEYVS